MEKQFSSLDRVMKQENVSQRWSSSNSKRLTKNKKIFKCTLLFFVTFYVNVVSVTNMFGQDVITLRNTEEIQAIVQEIGDVEIKYKKIENLKGPNYILKKSEIMMIKYENGSIDLFVDDVDDITEKQAETLTTTTSMPTKNSESVKKQDESPLEPLYIRRIRIYNNDGKKLSKYEARYIMRNEPDALNLYITGKKNRTTGMIFGIPGILITLTGLALTEDSNDDVRIIGRNLLLTGFVIDATSIIFFTLGNERIKQSVKTYNKGIRKINTSDISLNFGITNSGGIGFVLNF